MRTVFEEEPEIFEGRSTEAQWSAQVTNCGLDMVTAIDELIEKFEVKLHNGEYFDESVLR